MLPGEEHQQGPALPHPQGRFFFDTTHCLQGRFQGCCRDAALQCFSACAFPDLFLAHCIQHARWSLLRIVLPSLPMVWAQACPETETTRACEELTP